METRSPLRDLLRRNEYTPDSLRRLLNVRGLDDVGLLNHATALERIRDDRSAAATLIRLFFLEASEPLAALRRALSKQDVSTLLSSSLLRRTRTTASARLRIDPIDGKVFLADRRFNSADLGVLRLPRGDEVYPPSSDSTLLAEVVRQKPGGRVLDLCTGSGIQALQAEAADDVVAVDVNPRALAIARHNADLNGIDTIDFRLGDLYAPVRGERFDLIVANPPFVSSPYEDAPSYHSGGPTGDRVLRRVVRGWQRFLVKGGCAFAVSHVGVRRGTSLETVARSWFRGFPGRALVLVLETGSAVDLAAAQALFALRRGLAAYAKEQRRWLEYLGRHRIDSVSLILVAAERAGRAKVEVVDAHPRVLPLPLTPGPAERIQKWLVAS